MSKTKQEKICPDNVENCVACKWERKEANPLYRQGYEAGRKEERERILAFLKNMERGGLLDENEDLIREQTIIEITEALSNHPTGDN